MIDLLPDRLAWYVAGPVLGLLIVGMFAIANKPLGCVGAYAQAFSLARTRRASELWRVWFFVGIFLGGGIVGVLREADGVGFGYGALGDALSAPVLALVLLGGGFLLGFGGRWAGGCTMGHGLCGSALLARGSIAATATFMATAIVVSFIVRLISGGAL